VTESTLATLAAWSYGIALALYLALGVRMALGWSRSLRAALLLSAVLATALWAGACLLLFFDPPRAALVASSVADALRYGLWFAFVASLVAGGRSAAASGPGVAIPRAVVVAVALALLAGVALSPGLPVAAALGAPPRLAYGLDLGFAVFGLAIVEQVYRRVGAQGRWAIKPLCLALIGVFGYDLFLYADALLFGRIDAEIFAARGVANALVIPLIAIATARNDRWTIEMHLSRGVVFHSTALLVSGIFLLGLAGAGYIVRYFGGAWGRALQIELVFAGFLFALLVAFSGRFRSRLRVFISKHFFSYRYDYREEWLRFTRTLSTDVSSRNVLERTVAALADLVESPAGMLWVREEERGFVPAARWNMPPVDAVEPADGALPAYLARTGWVVSVPEQAADPDRYTGLAMPDWIRSVAAPWLIVPLDAGAGLLGFVVLGAPRAPIDVDWEVRDLLKTASRQAASYIGQLRATEALLEARKFDAFNRMSAFVVHDLKNLVAQLSLMLRNAERHRDNPEFQRDMLATVEHVVGRMNALMLQLRTGATPVDKPRQVDLAALVTRVCAAKQGARTPVALDLSPVSALGHEDRLEHVIGHLVQNALDATADGGQVGLRLGREGRYAVVEVRDSGPGMTAEFVRERLFKPFETTKQAGMGIGVYESAQYVHGLGGEIRVESAPGAGTSFRVFLPRGDEPAAAQPAPMRAARAQ
jgi:putative PEP-CTERM system histidine kinase